MTPMLRFQTTFVIEDQVSRLLPYRSLLITVLPFVFRDPLVQMGPDYFPSGFKLALQLGKPHWLSQQQVLIQNLGTCNIHGGEKYVGSNLGVLRNYGPDIGPCYYTTLHGKFIEKHIQIPLIKVYFFL